MQTFLAARWIASRSLSSGAHSRDPSVRNDVRDRDTPAHSRDAIAPEVWTNTLVKIEGAGNAGRPMRPIAARAMIAIERTRVGQVTPEIARHSPRNGFNGFLRALPGDRAFLPPSSADHGVSGPSGPTSPPRP